MTARASTSTSGPLPRRLRSAVHLSGQGLAIDETPGRGGLPEVLTDLVDLHDIGCCNRAVTSAPEKRPSRLAGLVRRRKHHLEARPD